MDGKKAAWVIGGVVLSLVLAGVVEAAPRSTRGDTAAKETKTSTRYLVIEVRDTKGNVSFEVIDAKDLTKRTKDCRTQYQEALKEWNTAKATAKKNKEAFTEKKPVEPYVRQMGSSFKTEQKAKEYADKLQQAYEARKAKKADEPAAKKSSETSAKPAADTDANEDE
ncbi:MAG TPA: hypothetical protein VMZ92_00060 [Planctomycetota bacterium]|nr:hypothetical protein [Planctomycetota bacterium]